MERTMPVFRLCVVLIDTWWNVNLLYLRTLPESDTRFNRYMVECEYCILDVVNSYFEVLIDTWWNVNVQEIEHNLIRYGF